MEKPEVKVWEEGLEVQKKRINQLSQSAGVSQSFTGKSGCWDCPTETVGPWKVAGVYKAYLFILSS
jgi:hypothetical protein